MRERLQMLLCGVPRGIVGAGASVDDLGALRAEKEANSLRYIRSEILDYRQDK
jgi:hypothetical protein